MGMVREEEIEKNLEYEEILYKYGKVISGLIPRLIILHINDTKDGMVQFSELYDLLEIVNETPGALSHYLRELLLLGLLEKPPRTRGTYRITEEGRKVARFIRRVIEILEELNENQSSAP